MKIQLSDTVSIDLDKLVESRLLVQANSGGGKSWAIRRLIEQAFGKVQIIVIDPEGEFGNMRAKFDFVYAGKGGDAPVESRSAALLAHRLLELEASAVIDLYELPPKERKHFVRLFCEALVNAPKDLWHDVLVILDEAHVFAPEKGESEALGAVIDLASRGRKRGYAAILATQRPAKLSKDAAAECNNKLIGRASLDIDRKRAAEELGFSTKEDVLSLRNLEPGQFYVFGPAISRDVEKTAIGDVSVKPAKRGVSKQSVPAPSAHVKKMLAKLANLPQEAAQEAETIAGLKGALTVAKRRIGELERQPRGTDDQAIEIALAKRDTEWIKLVDKWDEHVADIINFVCLIQQQAEKMYKRREKRPPHRLDKIYIHKPDFAVKKRLENAAGTFYTDAAKPTPDGTPLYNPRHEDVFKDAQINMGAGERQVLIAIAGMPDGVTREYITVQTGYKRSTRDAYIQRLVQKGYVESNRDGYEQSKIFATAQGVTALGSDYQPLPTGQELVDYHLKRLPEGEAKILKILIDHGVQMREHLTEATGFKRSTRDAYIQRLMSRQLVVGVGKGSVKASDHLI